MILDRDEIDLQPFGLEDDIGAGDGELANPALAKAPADHDAFGVFPHLVLEEALDHIGEFPREFLNRAVHQRRRRHVLADQHLVERRLADLLHRLLAERIVTVLLERLAQVLDDLLECALAGAIAEKPVAVLDLDIECIHVYRWQTLGTVIPDTNGRQIFFSHVAPERLKPLNNADGTK